MDDVQQRLGVYCSHSWKPRDVELNAQVWAELTAQCELLVDVPEELGANPPYHINRIEELLRRTDLFVCVLTHRPPKDVRPPSGSLQCSPYSLFEIRLAERKDIPRLILYERKTGFRPPDKLRAHEAYIPFERGQNQRLPEQRQWTTVVRPTIRRWLETVKDHYRPTSYEQSVIAAILVDEQAHQAAVATLEASLETQGYKPVRLGRESVNSNEAIRTLHEAGLAIAEFGASSASCQQLYAAAHIVGVPTIRLRATTEAAAPLPWILRGDPGGYEEDIVSWTAPEDLPALVGPRIASMFRLSPALRDEEAAAYFHTKRYAEFFVFLSHTLKPPHRDLVEQIFELLKRRHVTPFEYHLVNAAGQNWKEELDGSLTKTTHFVALLSDDYEQSPTCTYELETILNRTPAATILPFMVAGRNRPNPRLNAMNLHHGLLSSPDPAVDAGTIAERVIAALDDTLKGANG